MTTERERFEAWCRTTNSMPCEHKWIGWQAALSAPPDTENRRAQPAAPASITGHDPVVMLKHYRMVTDEDLRLAMQSADLGYTLRLAQSMSTQSMEANP